MPSTWPDRAVERKARPGTFDGVQSSGEASLLAIERNKADAIATALAPYFASESAFRLKRHLQIWG